VASHTVGLRRCVLNEEEVGSLGWNTVAGGCKADPSLRQLVTSSFIRRIYAEVLVNGCKLVLEVYIVWSLNWINPFTGLEVRVMMTLAVISGKGCILEICESSGC